MLIYNYYVGFVGHIFSVKLHQSKIYIGLQDSTINIPSSFVFFSSFSETFESLMSSIVSLYLFFNKKFELINRTYY